MNDSVEAASTERYCCADGAAFNGIAMIKNEREHHVTKAQAEKFERALADLSASGVAQHHSLLQKAQREAIQSQLEELQEQIAEYEARRLS
jgi:hypothetical protein